MLTNLTGSDLSYLGANAIAVSGNDIYVAGVTFKGATLWKNGISSILNTNNSTYPSDAEAIIINGNDVYIAGYIGEVPTYWKNGNVTTLGTSTVNATNIGFAIYNNNIYTADAIDSKSGNSIYWRNNIGYSFYNRPGIVNGIAIAPR